jgi:hypothetical protein
MEPQLSVVLFRRRGWGPDDYHRWSVRLAHEGRILCVPTRWQGQTVLRLVFINPATDPDRVLEVLAVTR